MKKKSVLYSIMTIIGVALLAAGLYMVKENSGSKSVAPYLLLGFGCGIFGHGFGEIISRATRKSSPEFNHQVEIEENDERNIALREKAQAKAYNIMIPLFGSLFVAFGFMKVDLRVLLLLLAAYLFVCGSSIYYRVKYEKEM